VAGVNPADINVLMIHLAKMQGMKADGGPHAASSSGTTGGIGADAGSAGSGVAPNSPPAESGMREMPGGLAVPGSSEIAVPAVSEAAGGIGADAGSAGSGVAPSSPSAESGMGDTSGRPDGGGLAVPAGSGVDDVLAQGLADLGIACGRAQTEKLLAYMEQVLELNRHLNLTSITDRAQFIIKHILDSLVCCNWPEIKEAERVVDIGTGAGFPGVPLAILMPEKSFILVDSLEKRLNAINGFIEYININNVLTKHARAESLAHQADFRESFDVCISRAVSELPVLAEYCLPFVKPGGWLYAYKGEAASQEMTKAEYAINLLGGRLTSIRDSGLEQYGIGHKIVIVEKTGLTPARYPRQAGKPEKAPLGTVKK
jgi:16S rRNA (guanine527-N7)-methyltransferase